MKFSDVMYGFPKSTFMLNKCIELVIMLDVFDIISFILDLFQL